MNGHTLAECPQGERLITLETILEQMSDTLEEQKELGKKTYEVLAAISLQGEQIRHLIVITGKHDADIEAAFKSIRRIELRHATEHGVEVADEKWKRNLIWLFERFAVPVLMTLCFIVWIGDKFNWFVKIAVYWKELWG